MTTSDATPTDSADQALSEAQKQYLAGADLAQGGHYEEAVVQIEKALALDPDLHTARLQLGLLLLTMGQAHRSLDVWQLLDRLPGDSYLRLFRDGMAALIRDDFPECLRLLRNGIETNTENAPLNGDMQILIRKVLETTSETADGDGTTPRTDFSLYGPDT